MSQRRFRPLLISCLIAALAVASALSWMAWRARSQRLWRESLEHARRDLESGHPRTAAKRLTELADQRPDEGEAWFLLGLCRMAINEPDEAKRVWERIADDSPAAGRSAFHLAKLEALRGRLGSAEAALARAAVLPGPQRFDARWEWVKMLRLQGRFDEARRRYLEGFGEYGDPIASLRELRRMETSPFPIEDAKQAFALAAAKAPDDPRVRLGQAHALMRSGRFDEAERLLSDSLAARPDDEPALRMLAELLIAIAEPERAALILARLSDRPEHLSLADQVLTRLAAVRGDRDGEQRAARRWLDREPASPLALSRAAEIAAAAKEEAEAKRLRGRKTELEAAKSRYDERLKSDDPRANAAELAELAKRLGWEFEAARWTELAGLGPPSTPAIADPSPPLAALASRYPELAQARSLAKPASASVAVPHFQDVAESSGLVFRHENGDDSKTLTPPVTSSGGVAVLDFDGDGWLDVYCVQSGRFPPRPDERPGDRLFRNQRNGTFADVSEPSKIASLARGYGHGVAVGDYDNDGDPDLLLTRWRRYQLLLNRGDGTFEDVTEASGLGGDRGWPTSAAFADLDNDGDLDLFVCQYLRWEENGSRVCVDPNDPTVYHCSPLSFPALPDQVFRNDGGRFADAAAASGIVDRDGRGLGVLAADVNDDGLIDLFVANDMSANHLWINRGGWRFEESGEASGVAANAGGGYQAGMGVACGDWDGDGLADLLVTNYYDESTSFFRGLGVGVFADQTSAIGLAGASKRLLGFGIALPDVNNDGRPDMITANGHVNDGRPRFPWKMPAQLLLNGPDGRVRDPGAAAGPAFEVLRMGRGLAVGDLDNDGRLDALVQGQNELLAYLRNDSSGIGASLTLRLEGVRSNRDGVGVKAIAEMGGRVRVRLRIGGGGYQSSSDPRLHFGLGPFMKAERLTVRWPSGQVDRYNNVAAGPWICREGETSLKSAQSSNSNLPTESGP